MCTHDSHVSSSAPIFLCNQAKTFYCEATLQNTGMICEVVVPFDHLINFLGPHNVMIIQVKKVGNSSNKKWKSIVVAVILTTSSSEPRGLSDVEGKFPMQRVSSNPLPADNGIWLSNDSFSEHYKWMLSVLDYSSHQRDTLNADLLVLRAIVVNKLLLKGKYNNGGQKLRRSDLVQSLSSSVSFDQHICHNRARTNEVWKGFLSNF
jgi:hypothetical protein